MRELIVSLFIQYVGVFNSPSVDQIYTQAGGSSTGVTATAPKVGDWCTLQGKKGIIFDPRDNDKWWVWFPGDSATKSSVEQHTASELAITTPNYLPQ